MSKRILMIVTSHDRMGDTGKPTGIWAEELAAPYWAFRDAGAEVDLASPQGGPVPLDPGSVKPVGQNEPAVDRFLTDETTQRLAASTRRVAEVDAAGYDALFFPGGHGTMWDLPHDEGVKRAVETAWAAGKVVAAVCHGPAGLVSARTPQGRSILEGRRVNGFTDAEEHEVGLAQTVPFLLERRMRELGGLFEHGNKWQAYAVRDGQLITGQNPQSSALVARHVLEALGMT
ncbi:MAG TPA: type 1 glutamine amidotransferase domain-containing protein [Burkholderiaceae bacterium]|nr:type 1 glutamine amidotransferase domain-containing protein [Burkholderiaceae bacterium]